MFADDCYPDALRLLRLERFSHICADRFARAPHVANVVNRSPVLSSRLNHHRVRRLTARVVALRVGDGTELVYSALTRAKRVVRVLATFAYELLTGPF